MDIFFNQKTKDIDFLSVDDEFIDLVAITETSDDLTQRLFIKLKTFIRDLWWNPTSGIDWLGLAFGIRKQTIVVDKIIKDVILGEPLVKELVSFQSEVSNYNYGCKFTVKHIEENKVSTFYILTNESGLVLTNEDGQELSVQI